MSLQLSTHQVFAFLTPAGKINAGLTNFPKNKRLLLSAVISGAAFTSANATANELRFDPQKIIVVDESSSSSTTHSVGIKFSRFGSGQAEWTDLTACTVSGTVQMKPRPNALLPQASPGEDVTQLNQSFSMRIQPYENEQGQIVVDDAFDEILFEIFDDGDESESHEEVYFEITSYGIACDDESRRSVSHYGDYGSFIINDPFSTSVSSSTAIPLRQKSLSTQLNSLRTLSLHNSIARDRSIAKEINRARDNSGFRADNLRVQLHGQSLPAGSLLGGAAGDPLEDFGRWGFFVSGNIDMGKQEKDHPDEDDFRSDMLIVGLDYKFSDTVVLGTAITYSDLDAGSDKTANTDFDRASLSVFSSLYYGDAFYLDTILTYATSQYDLDRRIVRDDGGSDLGAADTDGDEMSASIGAGYNFHHKSLNARLFSFVNYIDANIDGYSEIVRGSSSAAIVDGMDLQSLIANIGVELSWAVNTGFGVLTPMFSIAQERQFADDSVYVTGRFVGGLDAGEFQHTAPTRDENYLSAQTGLTAVLQNGVSTYISYDTFVDRRDFASEQWSIGIRWEY